MAPEVLNPSSKYHDASKADIWSFGITLIELLRGRPPLHYLSPRAAMAAIPRTSPPRLESDDPGASKMLRDLIHASLHDDPRRRPSATQLLKSFKSYFKHQRTNSITGSLARLGKTPKNEGNTANTAANKTVQRTAQSETIYSQWDFDISTLVIDESTPSEDQDASNKTDKEEDIIKSTEEEEEEEEVITTLPAFKLDYLQTTRTITETPSETKNSLKFRKLQVKSIYKSKIGGWDNKDTSILPIPCPQDSPDLARPQKYQ